MKDDRTCLEIREAVDAAIRDAEAADHAAAVKWEEVAELHVALYAATPATQELALDVSRRAVLSARAKAKTRRDHR